MPVPDSADWPATTSGPPIEDNLEQLWICAECGMIYDSVVGDPDGGIPPGTPFAAIPDTWVCPVCGARKAAFEPYVP